MEEFKEKVKGAMEKLEQQHREKTLSYKQEVQKWKDQKDLEYQQKLSEKEEALARERKNIENYIEEMKSWKESHHQKVEHLLNKKDEELKKKDDELKRISIKLESYEKGESLSPHSPSTKPQSKFKTSGSFIRKRTNSNNASPVIDNRGISSSSLLFLEPKNQLHNKATELQTKIEQLTQQKEEYEKIIQEAVNAKEKLSKIDKAIARNKKDWEETRKDIEKAEKQKMGKKEKDMSENDRSIASDPKWRRALLYAIPRIPIRYSDKTNCVHLEGPESEIIHTHHNYVAAYSLSAYPIIDGKREGDPICDRYCISIFPHCIIATIADGCGMKLKFFLKKKAKNNLNLFFYITKIGWGSPAREAALRASTKFVEYMTSEKNSIYTTRQAAKAILRAFLQAHKAIVSGVPEDIMFMCGTTTMLGGIAFPLSQDYQDGEPGEGEKWAFVFVSLGDCKAYRYNHRTKQLSDISIIFRETAIDPRDPGGRLGPHLGDGSADLRNLSIYCIECEEGDILSLVSDGVHDNLGKTKIFRINSNQKDK